MHQRNHFNYNNVYNITCYCSRKQSHA